MSRALRRAAMERMEATAAKLQPAQPILTIPARTLAGTHYVPTLIAGPFSRLPARTAGSSAWPDATWTAYLTLTEVAHRAAMQLEND